MYALKLGVCFSGRQPCRIRSSNHPSIPPRTLSSDESVAAAILSGDVAENKPGNWSDPAAVGGAWPVFIRARIGRPQPAMPYGIKCALCLECTLGGHKKWAVLHGCGHAFHHDCWAQCVSQNSQLRQGQHRRTKLPDCPLCRVSDLCPRVFVGVLVGWYWWRCACARLACAWCEVCVCGGVSSQCLSFSTPNKPCNNTNPLTAAPQKPQKSYGEIFLGWEEISQEEEATAAEEQRAAAEEQRQLEAASAEEQHRLQLAEAGGKAAEEAEALRERLRLLDAEHRGELKALEARLEEAQREAAQHGDEARAAEDKCVAVGACGACSWLA